MARKRRIPRIQKVDPKAISIRSSGMGYCTVLFDQTQLEKLLKLKFNPFDVLYQQKPKASVDKLRRAAGRGNWMAVASHPEILDSDGVPGLDIVFGKRNRSTKPKGPQTGIWFEPVTQFLNIPSGNLVVVYDEQFFEKEFDQATDQFLITEGLNEKSLDERFFDASSYIVECKPGFYRADVSSRDVALDGYGGDLAAQLAIYLTPITKPKSFPVKPALLPIHPPKQDIKSHRRKAANLPELTPVESGIQKDGSYAGEVQDVFGMNLMKMPKKFRKKMKLEPGLCLQLQVEGRQLDGIMIEGSTPDPTVWSAIEKAKKKAKNYATFHFIDDEHLGISIIKTSRKEPFAIQDGITENGVLRILKDADGTPVKMATKQKAKGNPNAVAIPKKIGKPGPAIDQLAGCIEKTFSLTAMCLFEVKGKTMLGAVWACPPISGTNIHGTAYTLASEITASVGQFKKGGVSNEVTKNFRGWPAGVGRAFKWVAGQAKGGMLWTDRFEVKVNFRGSKKKVTKKVALQASIDAWNEAMGLET